MTTKGETSLVLIPHGSVERSAEQDHDRFLFSSWGHFLLRRLSSCSFFPHSRTTPCVIVVRQVRERVLVLDTTYDRISLQNFFPLRLLGFLKKKKRKKGRTKMHFNAPTFTHIYIYLD